MYFKNLFKYNTPTFHLKIRYSNLYSEKIKNHWSLAKMKLLFPKEKTLIQEFQFLAIFYLYPNTILVISA